MRDNPIPIRIFLLAVSAWGVFSCSKVTQGTHPSPRSETPTSLATNTMVPSRSAPPERIEPSPVPSRDSVEDESKDFQDGPEDQTATATLEEEMETTRGTETPDTGREDQFPQVVQAKEDLARRLNIYPTEIKLLKFEAVTWPDSSLGCPKPGMAYLDVLTPGYLLILFAKGIAFEYHANRGELVVYCSNPGKPVPGTPTDI